MATLRDLILAAAALITLFQLSVKYGFLKP
jgi:hypothetical protein